MKRFASILALGALASVGLGSASADAQTTDTVVFETVDSYGLASTSSTSYATLAVTGVVQGATTATTETFIIDGASGAASCDRMLAVVLNRPGRFTFAVERYVNPNSSSRSCRLTRRP